MRIIGKTRGLARLADPDGHFRMVALDQRPPLFDVIAQARGISRDQVAFSDVTAAKRLLVEALAPHCSAMLLDPNFAVPAAIDLLPARSGLIVTLEEHRFQDLPGGRKSRAIADWSVEKIRAMGSDAVKVLAWYRPDAEPDVIEHQRRFIRQIGEDCARYDIPYVLELLVYPFKDSVGHTADYVEAPDKLSSLVIESVREFVKPDYLVDLLKLESPRPANSLPPPSNSSPATEAVQREFDMIGELCRQRNIPWVLLSAGAAPQQFERVLEYAFAAGASGFLAGRTIWLDAVRKHFPDAAAVASSLCGDGIAVLERLNSLTKAKGERWKARFPVFTSVEKEGDFARAY